jgi:hypothetical protein
MSDLPRRPLSADDTLPPVEPPNAGFLVQLFLVPAVIVGIIVCVYLAFYWLAHLGNDPQASLKALQRNTEGRWHAALNFANDLRGRDGARLKNDPALATQLAAILDAEVASGRPRLTTDGGEQARTLCGYLCRALGEFAVPEAAAPLLARIADPTIPQVAQAAVEAIAVLAENLKEAKREFPDPAAVSAALLAASRTEDAALRSRAATPSASPPATTAAPGSGNCWWTSRTTCATTRPSASPGAATSPPGRRWAKCSRCPTSPPLPVTRRPRPAATSGW